MSEDKDSASKGGGKQAAFAVLGVLAIAWLGLMWFFNLFDSFWWSVLSVAVIIPVLLWASSRARSEANSDSGDEE